MSQHSALELRAASRAAQWHGEQHQARRFSGDPYILHPAAVAQIVRSVTSDPEVLAASWLHDVVEDTRATLEDIEKDFGPRVRDLVRSLTKVSRASDGNRERRAAIDRDFRAGASAESQTIMLADLLDNLPGLVAHDPKFARVYVREKILLVGVLSRGAPELHQRARDMLQTAQRQLSAEAIPLAGATAMDPTTTNLTPKV